MVRVILLALIFGATTPAFGKKGHPGETTLPSESALSASPTPKTQGTSTKVIPLPIYATSPNEGSTFGFMPVFLVVEKATERTKSIIAPSLSWNRIIRFTHTFRWYHYPSAIETLNVVPSFSTNVNRGVTLEYFRLPRGEGLWTLESGLHIRRSIFFRFFGLGPETTPDQEASYTRIAGDFGGRLGYNLTRNINIGANITFERHIVENKNVTFLPLAPAVFPEVPGWSGATTLFEGISVRYDMRENYQYSESGFASELTGGITQGLAGTDTFSRVSWETLGLWRELHWLQGAARAYWSYVGGGSDIPFYYLNSLGGSNRLRGYADDRFFDKGAWEVEFEQRIRLLRTHIYGVTADWRVDPFIAVGQVYSSASEMFRHVRVTGGLGFRAFVRPNILGRVDTAFGGEGLKIYVELGYPY